MSVKRWRELPLMTPDNIDEVVAMLGVKPWEHQAQWNSVPEWLHDPGALADERFKRHQEWQRRKPNQDVSRYAEGGDYVNPTAPLKRSVKIVPRPVEENIVCVAEFVAESRVRGMLALNICSGAVPQGENLHVAAVRTWQAETQIGLADTFSIATLGRDETDVYVFSGTMDFSKASARDPKERAHPFAVNFRDWVRICNTRGIPLRNRAGVHVDSAAATLAALQAFQQLHLL